MRYERVGVGVIYLLGQGAQELLARQVVFVVLDIIE
jgi:hypothetical protein